MTSVGVGIESASAAGSGFSIGSASAAGSGFSFSSTDVDSVYTLSQSVTSGAVAHSHNGSTGASATRHASLTASGGSGLAPVTGNACHAYRRGTFGT